MLTQLDIRNIVLIDQLQIDLCAGLSVLTGETGAGKSILLDALGLVRGERMDVGLIRAGTDQASVSAGFDLPPHHVAYTLLQDQGIDLDRSEPLTIRRVIARDGKSRAFINDHTVSIQLLKTIGYCVIDIHGQFDTGRLFDATYHRDIVDLYGDLAALRNDVAAAFHDVQSARDDEERLRAAVALALRDQAYLRATLDDLIALDPQVGEEEKLLDRKKYIQDSAQILSLLAEAQTCLSDENGAETQLHRASRALERLRTKWPGQTESWLNTVDQALSQIRDVAADIEQALSGDHEDDQTIDQVEDRLYALRGLARRLNVVVDDLSAKKDELRGQIEFIADQSEALARAAAQVQRMEVAYLQRAGLLTQKRRATAQELDRAIRDELPPLKLDKATFTTAVDPLFPPHYGPLGADRVQFMVSTNPGLPAAALDKIVSGGELSRLMLALKVVVQAAQNDVRTLIFDEVDAGLGGAVAAAVADRLKRLSVVGQVLVVTHAPQVAAVADHHYVIEKSTERGVTTTSINRLIDAKVRREEIARMLSGAMITDEARAAAMRLLDPKVA